MSEPEDPSATELFLRWKERAEKNWPPEGYHVSEIDESLDGSTVTFTLRRNNPEENVEAQA